jgi:hypothetical protein
MSPGLQRTITASQGRARGPSPPRRRMTSFKLRVEKKEPQFSRKEELKQATYPVYRLRWEKLKAFLEKRFPEHKFEERRVCPYLLTSRRQVPTIMLQS